MLTHPAPAAARRRRRRLHGTHAEQPGWRSRAPRFRRSSGLCAQTRHELAVLAGRFPATRALPEFTLESLHCRPDIPSACPRSWSSQRPDIRASEALLHAASAEVGVATANLYPQIDLSGASARRRFNRQPAPGQSAWSIGAALLQPIFNGGALPASARCDRRLRPGRRAIPADGAQRLPGTSQTRCARWSSDAERLHAQAEADRCGRAAADLTRRQLPARRRQLPGAARRAAHLPADRASSPAAAQATRYADTAALFQALGGGWWNRPELPISRTPTRRAQP